MKNIVLDFVASHSTGKTTVINGISEILKEQGREHNIVESESRKVAEEGTKIYRDTTSLVQCHISVFNWGNVLTSSMNYPLTLCTDWAVRSLAYAMTSENVPDRVVNMHKQWLDLFHSRSLTHHVNVFHIYIPIEFPVVPDGIRTLDEDYRERVDNAIFYVFDSCKVPYLTLTGTPEERVTRVIEFLDKITCQNHIII